MNATPLCVVMLVPGYGERDILKGIGDAGGCVIGHGELIWMPQTTTDQFLGDLCELQQLRSLYLLNTTAHK
jgi:hypothetical protein